MNEETKQLIRDACERAIAELTDDEYSKDAIFVGVTISLQREIKPGSWQHTAINIGADNGEIQDITRDREVYSADDPVSDDEEYIIERGTLIYSKYA